MSNDTKGSHKPSRRKVKASSQSQDYEDRSNDSLDIIHGNLDDTLKPAVVLGSSERALQRLADVSRLLASSSIHQDLNDVEAIHGKAIENDKEIRKLKEVVKALTDIRDGQMEILRQENAELKSGEAACKQEKEKCRTIQAELKAQQEVSDSKQKEEYEKRLQKEKNKIQKYIDVKKAELEAGNRSKLQEFEKQIQELSTANKALEKDELAIKDKLKTTENRNARVEKSLEDENRSLSTELEQAKSEFPVERQPVQE